MNTSKFLTSITISLLFPFYTTTASYSQTKNYTLIDKKNGADIDLERLKHLNDYGAGYHNLNKVFKPCEGKFIVWRFIATFQGFSHSTEKRQKFHDLIILKTDSNNIIKEGYQYTLEWAEMPSNIDLYKVSVKNKKLVNHLNIQKLQFTNTEYKGQKLNEVGILTLY